MKKLVSLLLLLSFVFTTFMACSTEDDSKNKPCSHSYSLTYSCPSTCTSQGYDTYKCGYCQNTYRSYKSLAPHSYMTTEVEANCVHGSYTLTECINCEYSKKSSEEDDMTTHLGIGNCYECDLDFFDTFASLIEAKGTRDDEGGYYYYYFKPRDDVDSYLIFALTENGNIVVSVANTKIKNVSFAMGLKKGVYEIKYDSYDTIGFKMTGTFETDSIKESTEYLPYDTYNGLDGMVLSSNKLAASQLRTLLIGIDIFLLSNNCNMTVSNLGFVNY